MKRKLILLSLLPMLLAGCEFEPDSISADCTSTVYMVGMNQKYEQEFVLKHDALSKPSNQFSKDLALFTYGAAVANQDKNSITKFYRDMMFSNLELSSSYDSEPTKESIAYAIGSRNLNFEKVVLVSVRGFNYGAEWSSNLDIGLTGDHAGFLKCAETLLSDLDDYITTYHKENAKFIFTGYSRGGAVANLCAKLLFERENKLVKDENLYFYTFEAPKGCAEYKDYKNVFNIINKADVVPLIAPEEYGFYRVGQDIYLDIENVDEKCHEYNENIVLPEFTPFEMFDDEEIYEDTLPQAIIHGLLLDSYEEVGIDTREKFVSSIQGTLDYFNVMFMSLPSQTLSNMLDDLNEMPRIELLSMIGDPEKIVEFLKPFLDGAGFVYNEAELLSYTTQLSQFITAGPGLTLLLLYGLYVDNLTRMIYMHSPEINYPLLEVM